MTANWGECYFDHFERFLRGPTDRAVFRQDPASPSIQVLEFDKVFPGCRVFASLGLCQFAARTSRLGEVVVATDGGWGEVPTVLANSLFYMVQHRMELGWGVAISGIEAVAPSFPKEYQKVALYITSTSGFPAGFGEVVCGPNTGHVFVGFFISRPELEYFRRSGASAFEDLLESEGVDPFCLGRASAV